MNYPEFYNQIEKIILQDDLANLLGAFKNGIIEFSYIDVVKTAGHSCPTVAGAYLCTLVGLKELYKDELPKRGEISVEFKEDINDGVAGVIGNVISNITGATTNNGFKGLNGNFARINLMHFNSEINSSVRFTRNDTNQSIDINYDPSQIPPNPKQQELMAKISKNIANNEEKKEFGIIWQERVKNIFENIEKVIIVKK